MNDLPHEGDESFRLVLGTPVSSTAGAATLGGQNTARVVIHDFEDGMFVYLVQIIMKYKINGKYVCLLFSYNNENESFEMNI